MAANPRKRRKSRRRSRRRYGRRGRGGIGRVGIVREIQASMPNVGWGMVGYVGTAYIPTIASRFIALPDKVGNPIGYWLTKIGAAAATSFAVRQFAGRSAGRYAFTGSLITMGAELANEMIFPMIGLGTYLPPELGAPLPETEGAAYLSPGAVAEDYALPPARLNPDYRI